MSAPALLPLDCPSCGTPLPGLEDDLAFACNACGRAWELTDGRFTPRAFVQVAPTSAPDQKLINLPVWQFPVRVSVRPGDHAATAVDAGTGPADATPASAPADPTPRTASTGSAPATAPAASGPLPPSFAASERRAGVQRAAERAAELHTGYALACSVPRTEVFGDWGHRWTGLQPVWKPGTRAHPVVGVSLSSADAGMLIEHYILDLLDRLADLRTLNVSVEHGEPRLLGLPAALDDERVVSPWGNDLALPVHALDSWVELRKHATIPA